MRQMTKKLLLLLLALVTVLGLTACGGSDSDATPFSGGSGTEADPFRISTPADLQEMARRINSEDREQREPYLGSHYVLTNDIDMKGKSWESIGTYLDFAGVFDGCGHTVSGIHLKYSKPLTGTAVNDHGFFSKVRGGTVKNLTISDSAFTLTGSGYSPSVGAVTGHLSNGILENCHVTADVTVSSSFEASGICGTFSDSQILNCSNAAAVTGTENVSTAAGIACSGSGTVTGCTNSGLISCPKGDAAGVVFSMGGSIIDCVNSGDVAAQGIVGGICGFFGDGALNSRDNDATVTMRSCVNSGSIASTKDYAGGITARADTGSIVDCVNSGSVAAPKEAGGILALFQLSAFGTEAEDFTVSGCINSGAVNGGQESTLYPTGGICGSSLVPAAHMVFENCTNSGTITGGGATGGILGSIHVKDLTVTGCENSGVVTGVEACGGILGSAEPFNSDSVTQRTLLISKCTNSAAVHTHWPYAGKNIYAGGIAGNFKTVFSSGADLAFDSAEITDCTNTGPVTCGEGDGIYTACIHDLCGSWAESEE